MANYNKLSKTVFKKIYYSVLFISLNIILSASTYIEYIYVISDRLIEMSSRMDYLNSKIWYPTKIPYASLHGSVYFVVWECGNIEFMLNNC